MTTIDYLRLLKIGGYAVFDIAISFIGIYIIAPFLTKLFSKINLYVPLRSWMLFTIPIGIITHFLIGNITPMTKAFADLNGSYGLKFVIISMIIIGIKNIKIIRNSPNK